MRTLPVAAIVLGTFVSSLSGPIAPAFSDLAPTAYTSASDIDLDAAVPGSLLPGRPRLPNGARFLGADESYVLYNTGHLDPTTGELVLTLATRFEARIDVNGKDATSLLGVMSLGLDRGDEVVVSATGREAEEAVGRLADLVESGFGEV